MSAAAQRTAGWVPALYERDVDAWLREGPMVVPCRIATKHQWLNWEIHSFPAPRKAAPDLRRMVRDLSAWTQWSSRALAEVLGTTHTTVQALSRGRGLVESRSGDLGDRIVEAFRVAERIHKIAHEDPAQTSRALSRADAGGVSAAQLLRARRPSAAYLVALDELRPREQGLLVGSRPARDGATVSLTE